MKHFKTRETFIIEALLEGPIVQNYFEKIFLWIKFKKPLGHIPWNKLFKTFVLNVVCNSMLQTKSAFKENEQIISAAVLNLWLTQIKCML